MSVRNVKCAITVVSGSGAPQVGVTVQATPVGPTGVVLVDSAGEEIDPTPLTAVTNASGVATFDPASSPTNGLIAPGGDFYHYISGSLVAVTGGYWQISYLQTVIYSPAFAYTASTLDMATWPVTPGTLGLMKFYLTNVLGSGAPVLSRSFNVSLSSDAFWTGGVGTGQRIPGGASFPLTTDGTGTVIAYVIRNSELNPTTGAWQMPDLINGGTTFWQAPDTYGANDAGVYNAGTTYAINKIVRRASDDEPFISLANANVGNALSDATKWADYAGINIESIATRTAPIGASAAISQTALAADSAVLTGSFGSTTLQDELRQRFQADIRNTGAWSGATAYLVNDAVQLSGTWYVCILAHTNHTPPNATYWSALGSGGGGGGVTSVSGVSPLSSSGGTTPAISIANQAANTILAGPTSGGSGAVSARPMVGADMPAATVSTRGGVRPDGTTITISGDVISASGGGTDATPSTVGVSEIDQSPPSGHPRALTVMNRNVATGLALVGADGMISTMYGPRSGATGAITEVGRYVQSGSNPLFGGTTSSAAQEPVVLIENGVWRMWYTHVAGGVGANGRLALATSTDGVTWTGAADIFGKGVGGYSGPVEHFSLFRQDGVYYLYFADTNNGNWLRSTSTDGSTWLTPSTVLAQAAVGWSQGWNNSYVWTEGSTWWALIEGANGSGLFLLTLATSADGLAWTLPLGGFIGSLQPAGTGTTGGPWMMAPQKRNGLYHLWYHGSNNGANTPTDIYHATAKSLTGTWTISNSGSPIIAHDSGGGFDQAADPCLVEWNGQVSLYYERVLNSSSDFEMMLATAACTMAELLDGLALPLLDPTTTEGDLIYRHSGVLTRLPLGTGLNITAGALNATGAIWGPLSNGSSTPLILNGRNEIMIGPRG